MLEAAGPAAAVTYHALYEMGGAEAVAQALPNGAAWVDRIEAVPQSERHLAVHDGHLIKLSEIDRETIPREVVPEMTVTGTPDEVRIKLDAIAASGLTEIAYQPQGPDIRARARGFHGRSPHRGRLGEARARGQHESRGAAIAEVHGVRGRRQPPPADQWFSGAEVAGEPRMRSTGDQHPDA